MVDEKKIRELYLRYENVRNELNTLLAEKNVLENKLNELNITLEALNEFNKVKEGDRLLSSLGSGVFIEAEVANTKEFIVNVGARVLKKMSLANTKEFVKERINTVEKTIKEMEAKLAQDLQILQDIEGKLQKLSERKEK